MTMDGATLEKVLRRLSAWKSTMEEPVVERVRDRHERDPFLILVATILSLRTRDTVTEQVFKKLYTKVKCLDDLLAIDEGELEALIRSSGFYKNKVKVLKNLAVELRDRFGGEVPGDLEKLLSIKGVGRKTANLVVIEGFSKYGICVDTHVHRIMNWWGYVKEKTPDETEMALRKKLPRKWWRTVNNILVTFGQNVCKPVGPKCSECPVGELCTYPGKRVRVG